MYWASEMPRAVFERAIAHSLPFGLYAPDGTQRGFARVTTDRATYAHLQDVFIFTPIFVDGQLTAIVSLHVLGEPRAWTDEDAAACRRAAGRARELL